ncbi:hypothetical protein D3C73_574120 [compost metagenome]
MINNLESDYDCANAGFDLHSLKEELDAAKTGDNSSKEAQDHLNRLNNQISFIENKCSIRS